MTIGLVVSSTAVAILYPNILFMLSFLGGIFGVMFIIIIPSKSYTACFMMTMQEIPWTSWKGIGLMIFNFIVFGCGVIGTVQSYFA